MTVKLLTQWGEQPAGTLYTSTAQTEAAMVADKVATTTLTGGVEWDPPKGEAEGLSAALLLTSGGLVQGGAALTAGERASARIGIGSVRNPGNGQFTVDDLLPTHRPVFNPETITAGSVTVAASLTATIDAAPSTEFYRNDLTITVAGAVGPRYASFPIPVDHYGNKARFGFRTHVRLYCDDWSRVHALSIAGYVNTTSDMVSFMLVDNGASAFGCKDSMFSSAWSGKYRTFQLQAPQRIVAGTVPAWGTGDGAPEDLEIVGMRVLVSTTGACVIKINRVYSSHWPCGTFTLIGDGAYDQFKANALTDFRARDWRGGVSLYHGRDQGPIYPTFDDLSDFANAGWDVYPHMRSLTANAALAGTETAAELELSNRALANRIRTNTTAKQAGLRFIQCLQGSGKTNAAGGLFFNQELGRFGIETAREMCSDSQWGINPYAANPPFNNALGRPVMNDGSTIAVGHMGFNTGWIPPRGRFNFFAGQLYSWNKLTTTPLERDTYFGSLVQQTLNRASEYQDSTWQFTHNIMNYDGTEPTSFNSGTNHWRGLLADLDAKVQDGKIIVLSPSEHASLTYLRQGDVRVRWDGEWVYRDDPTRIAF